MSSASLCTSGSQALPYVPVVHKRRTTTLPLNIALAEKVEGKNPVVSGALTANTVLTLRDFADSVLVTRGLA